MIVQQLDSNEITYKKKEKRIQENKLQATSLEFDFKISFGFGIPNDGSISVMSCKKIYRFGLN